MVWPVGLQVAILAEVFSPEGESLPDSTKKRCRPFVRCNHLSLLCPEPCVSECHQQHWPLWLAHWASEAVARPAMPRASPHH